jgi:hypothetical protein
VAAEDNQGWSALTHACLAVSDAANTGPSAGVGCAPGLACAVLLLAAGARALPHLDVAGAVAAAVALVDALRALPRSHFKSATSPNALPSAAPFPTAESAAFDALTLVASLPPLPPGCAHKQRVLRSLQTATRAAQQLAALSEWRSRASAAALPESGPADAGAVLSPSRARSELSLLSREKRGLTEAVESVSEERALQDAVLEPHFTLKLQRLPLSQVRRLELAEARLAALSRPGAGSPVPPARDPERGLRECDLERERDMAVLSVRDLCDANTTLLKALRAGLRALGLGSADVEAAMQMSLRADRVPLSASKGEASREGLLERLTGRSVVKGKLSALASEGLVRSRFLAYAGCLTQALDAQLARACVQAAEL